MNLTLNLTEMELDELRQRTKANDSADAVSCAAREFLRICRSRELTLMSGSLDYDESAWQVLDQAELNEPWISIDTRADTRTRVVAHGPRVSSLLQ